MPSLLRIVAPCLKAFVEACKQPAGAAGEGMGRTPQMATLSGPPYLASRVVAGSD
jgi:hypothetical protein